ncbi:hypothetical protein CJF42_19585 [Pseudoalteromonas sp. NBT06-2]|uniref:hypothetical protein n=1 Tax=Pseudoalteromonas sp. NBT06-2 TaxID=2025950 RepID=UPI000BA6ACD4|nr:hypothetical protein [Pseudoalteromonas sp. NBT06-2]PAJ72757.1 hypothetical protein CJF42_19585 [Pseudoalteromonas sp. NBT06-2]
MPTVQERIDKIEEDIEANAEKNTQTTAKNTKRKTSKKTKSKSSKKTESNQEKVVTMQDFMNMFMSMQKNKTDSFVSSSPWEYVDDDEEEEDPMDAANDIYLKVFTQLIKTTEEITDILKSAYTINQFIKNSGAPRNNLERIEIKEGKTLRKTLIKVLEKYKLSLNNLNKADDMLKPALSSSMHALAAKHRTYSLDWESTSSKQIIEIAVEKAKNLDYESFRTFITHSILDISQLGAVITKITEDEGKNRNGKFIKDDDVVRAIINERYDSLANKTRETVIELDDRVKRGCK